jgi:hypothetical protein
MCKPATPIGLDDGIKGQGNHVDQGIDCPHLSPSQSRFALRATGIEEVAVQRRGRPEQMPCSVLRCPRLGAPKSCSQLHKTPEDFSTASGENSAPNRANSRQNRVVSVVPRDASVPLMRQCPYRARRALAGAPGSTGALAMLVRLVADGTRACAGPGALPALIRGETAHRREINTFAILSTFHRI